MTQPKAGNQDQNDPKRNMPGINRTLCRLAKIILLPQGSKDDQHVDIVRVRAKK